MTAILIALPSVPQISQEAVLKVNILF